MLKTKQGKVAQDGLEAVTSGLWIAESDPRPSDFLRTASQRSAPSVDTILFPALRALLSPQFGTPLAKPEKQC